MFSEMPTECQQIKYWVGVLSQKGVSKAHAGVVTRTEFKLIPFGLEGK